MRPGGENNRPMKTRMMDNVPKRKIGGGVRSKEGMKSTAPSRKKK